MEAKEAATFRLANPSDIDDLLELCRKGYRTARWQVGGAFARRWWASAIDSKHAEVWVCLLEGRLVGVAVLVWNEQGWARERRARCGGRSDYVRAILRAPRLAITEAATRLRLRWAFYRDPLRHVPQTSALRSWMELLLVAPEARGRAIAYRLKRHCEDRSVALGCKVLESSVHPANLPMRRLNEKMGYKHTRQTKAGCIYSKVL